jgi:anthranilate phosphoribosyltransferase
MVGANHMNPVIRATERISQGFSLDADEMAEVISQCMAGLSTHAEISALLTALHRKGETAEELVGAARAMRQFMTPIACPHDQVIDTCGTGGGRSGIFNVSTAAAIVAAAAGATVAKHGNRKSTSQSGSADVLQVLGVNIEAPVAVTERCLREIGLGFCFAPLLHPSVKNVMAVRRSLDFPTIFNLLGPLCNPARANYQLLGAGRGETQAILAQALGQLGCRAAWVVHSGDGLGEISASAPTDTVIVAGQQLELRSIGPADFDLPLGDLAEIRVSSPEASAALIEQVLNGQGVTSRSIVVMNAAAALVIAGKAASLPAARMAAEAAIDSGRAREVLRELIRLTQSG